MKKLFVLLALVLASTLSVADAETREIRLENGEVHLDITNLEDGNYHLIKLGDEIALIPVTIVKVSPTPPNPPPPPPPSQDLHELSKQKAVEVNDPDTARTLAVGYSVIVIRATQGKYETVDQIASDTKAVYEKIIYEQEDVSRWQPWSDAIKAAMTAMAQEGKLQTVDDYTKALKAIYSGLVAASPQAAGKFDLEKILEVVQIVLQVIEDDTLSLNEILEIVTAIIKLFNGIDGTAA